MEYAEVEIAGIGADSFPIAIARVIELGYEGFLEEPYLLKAYIPVGQFKEAHCDIITSDFPAAVLTWHILPDINWNGEWEKNYKPVLLHGRCLVRAPFHKPDKGAELEIVIEPKMSFGTAHHETTAMMAAYMLDHDVRGRQVLDMGCGTGILAILASMLGAEHITAIDNDEWAFRNAAENVALNGTGNVSVEMGDASLLKTKSFNLILANINRNVLLNDIPHYAEACVPGGALVLSGFYLKDLDIITAKASGCGFNYRGSLSQNDWALAHFTKNI